jgi:hypothetical protein
MRIKVYERKGNEMKRNLTDYTTASGSVKSKECHAIDDAVQTKEVYREAVVADKL